MKVDVTKETSDGTVNINGTDYVPKSLLLQLQKNPISTGPIKIVVLERGFIYVGKYEEEGGESDTCTITNARSLIQWGTTGHLGELVNGPTAKTKLGDPCIVKSRLNQVLYTIEVDQNAWIKHIG